MFLQYDIIKHFNHFIFSSYGDLLDLSCVGDDLLHDLHGLALCLSCLSLTLGSLDDLYLLALTHLHGHRRTLMERKEDRHSNTLVDAWRVVYD